MSFSFPIDTNFGMSAKNIKKCNPTIGFFKLFFEIKDKNVYKRN